MTDKQRKRLDEIFKRINIKMEDWERKQAVLRKETFSNPNSYVLLK